MNLHINSFFLVILYFKRLKKRKASEVFFKHILMFITFFLFSSDSECRGLHHGHSEPGSEGPPGGSLLYSGQLREEEC